MKLFEEPKMEVVKFTSEDVITASADPDPGFFTDPCIN